VIFMVTCNILGDALLIFFRVDGVPGA